MKKIFLLCLSGMLGIGFTRAQLNGDLCVRQFCNFEPLGNVYLHLDADSADFAPPYAFLSFPEAGPCWDLPDSPVSPGILLSPYKKDLPLNGVSTYDLVLISQHIMGVTPFTEPWQWIAADVNHDNEVTNKDIVELRKLILGIYEELPDNNVWRFVRSDYIFPQQDPLSQPFPESISVGDLLRRGQVTFLGIKIGDLSCEPAVSGVYSPEALPSPDFPVAVFPNPGRSSVYFSFKTAETLPLRIQIRDLAGRVVYDAESTELPGEKSLEIPAAAFPSTGLYIWTLGIGGKTITGKLIRSF